MARLIAEEFQPDPEPEAPVDPAREGFVVFTDGTPQGTQVYAPNGENVSPWLKSLSFNVQALDTRGTLTLEVDVKSLTIVRGEFDVVDYSCKVCGQVVEHDCKGPPF